MKYLKIALTEHEATAFQKIAERHVSLAAEYFEDTQLDKDNNKLIKRFKRHLNGSGTYQDAQALVMTKILETLADRATVANSIRMGWFLEFNRKNREKNEKTND